MKGESCIILYFSILQYVFLLINVVEFLTRPLPQFSDSLNLVVEVLVVEHLEFLNRSLVFSPTDPRQVAWRLGAGFAKFALLRVSLGGSRRDE